MVCLCVSQLQKWPNRSMCCLGGGCIAWAQGTIIMCGTYWCHAIWQIRLNNPCLVAMWAVAVATVLFFYLWRQVTINHGILYATRHYTVKLFKHAVVTHTSSCLWLFSRFFVIFCHQQYIMNCFTNTTSQTD